MRIVRDEIGPRAVRVGSLSWNLERYDPTPRKFSLFLIFLTVVIDLLGFGIVLPLLARYGKHFGLSGWELGILMASFSAMQFVFAPVWGRLSDRIGRRSGVAGGVGGVDGLLFPVRLCDFVGNDGKRCWGWERSRGCS